VVGGHVLQSFATGRVKVGANSQVGGLIGDSGGGVTVQNSYAMGATKSGGNSETGGLIGTISDSTLISTSYSTGRVKGHPEFQTGGLIGEDHTGINLSHNYWDTDTTGKSGRQGCSDERCGGHSKGLTTEQLQSGLPDGFDPSIWSENANINGGLPYLLANAAPK
jgi:hypothetical protein